MDRDSKNSEPDDASVLPDKEDTSNQSDTSDAQDDNEAAKSGTQPELSTSSEESGNESLSSDNNNESDSKADSDSESTKEEVTSSSSTKSETPATNDAKTDQTKSAKLPDISTLTDDDATTVQMPGAVVSGQSEDSIAPASAVLSNKKVKRRYSKSEKMMLILLVVIVLLGGSAAAFYYGYYINPSVVWRESLNNTGLGYNKLISYVTTQSQTHYSGYTENGTFSLQALDTNYSGSFNSQSAGGNMTGSLKLDTGAGNVDVELRSIQVPGVSEPDEYFQVNGLKSVSSFFGPIYGPKLATLDGQWIVIDHNMLADLTQELNKQVQAAAGSKPKLTWGDINSFLQAAGTVNQKYVFTTNSATSVTKVLKTYGEETVDGNKTFHYKVGFVPAHVKAYVAAMCSALTSSGLGTYLSKENLSSDVNSSCQSLENAVTKINSTDSIDVWADINTRLLYKVRLSDPSNNPAENFVDIGLNYKGGSVYPFFINAQSKSGKTTYSYSVVASLNSQANAVNVALNFGSSTDKTINMHASLTVEPTTSQLHLTAPANAMPITTVLTNLGFGQYLTEIENGLASTPMLPNSTTSL